MLICSLNDPYNLKTNISKVYTFKCRKWWLFHIEDNEISIRVDKNSPIKFQKDNFVKILFKQCFILSWRSKIYFRYLFQQGQFCEDLFLTMFHFVIKAQNVFEVAIVHG
jgi:hypothetical protein